ncbi:hypothetical protein PS854_01536 [Pseudomonas fluorescens]|uniref:Uncharacterized protein n=1 Tax=Pseudomonas fluorescens TaxID=294 RepID=A0A5E7IX77_PSEFL|nr:hypothetical protein PS854_01536 [Pseudomonas fluorescens]
MSNTSASAKGRRHHDRLSYIKIDGCFGAVRDLWLVTWPYQLLKLL